MSTCLFCKSKTNTFLSIEHIYPESLGNKEKILPKGIVCDTCNNGVLSTLDSFLVNFDPIIFCRTFYGVESKSGKVPKASFSSLSLDNPSKKHVNLRLKRKNKQDFIETTNGFNLKFIGKTVMSIKNIKLLARALYKIGLELLCLDQGQNACLGDKFDDIRNIILGNKDFNGYLLFGTNKLPDKLGVYYRLIQIDGGTEIALFEFNYMFFKVIFDIERREIKLNNGEKLEGLQVIKF